MNVDLADPPGAPRNLEVTDINKDLISVAWKKPKSDGGSPVTGYCIELRTCPKPEYEPVGQVDANTTNFTVTGLAEDARYYLRVGAENPAGVSEDYAELKSAVVTKAKKGGLTH